jgi:phage gp45-like
VIRLIIWLAIIIGIVWFSVTVKLGQKTLVEHVRAIWHTNEVQDLKHGVEDKAGPTVDKLERGAKAGYKAMDGSGSNAVVIDAGGDARELR